MPIHGNRRDFLAALMGSLAVPDGGWARLAMANVPDRSRLDAPPMIGRVTRDAAEISMFAGSAGDTRVLWGRRPDDLTREIGTSERGDLHFRLDGLAPGDTHYYRVDRRPRRADGFVEGPLQRIRTQKRRGNGFRFGVLADAHLVRPDETRRWYENLRRAVEVIARDDLDFLIFVGDESSIDGSGRASQAVQSQRQAHERYAMMRRLYAPLLGSTPGFFVLGNHDGERWFKRTLRAGDRDLHLMRWGAIARKRFLLNPGPDTYPEGGEDEGWQGPPDDPALGGAPGGHRSPLHNYYAWSWGDATFAVLDPYRYSRRDPEPIVPEDWTLGDAQLAWLERVLADSDRAHKFVICHHLVGGGPWSADTKKAGAYGRGGARVAHLGEQARINGLMRRHGARFFLYGHDHVFAHGRRDGIHYVCCGRPWRISDKWWRNRGWRKMYGKDFLAVAGYTAFDVTPEAVTMTYRVVGKAPTDNRFWNVPLYTVGPGGLIEVDQEVTGGPSVWARGDASEFDLFRGGGSYDGRTILLGRRWNGAPGDRVHVMHPGQTAYQRTFRAH